MTYLQILNLIKDTALAQPNVNSVVREFIDLNREDAVYSAVVIQDRDGLRDRIQEQDYNTYTWYLGYVDRLCYDESNRDDVFSTGINIINNIVASIRDTWFPEVEVNIVDRFNTFNQRFTASCAGVYVVLAVNVPVSDCVDPAQEKMYDSFSAVLSENGDYHFVPSGRPVDEIDITVDVSGGGEKPEERLIETISSNGSYSYSPSAGAVFSGADITVSVPEKVLKRYKGEEVINNYTGSINLDPSTIGADGFSEVEIEMTMDVSSIYETITSNGEYHREADEKLFNTVDIKVSVPSDRKPESICVETIRENGSSHFTPAAGEVFNDVYISTDVHPSGSYSGVFTSNGVYNIAGEFSGGSVAVSVPQAVLSSYEYQLIIEDDDDAGRDVTIYPSSIGADGFSEVTIVPIINAGMLTTTISSNGGWRFDPDEYNKAYFNYVSLSVDVHPSVSLSKHYYTNGTKTIDGEFSGGTVTISVHPSVSLSRTYASNGVYSITGEFNGGSIAVQVPDGSLPAPDSDEIYYTTYTGQVLDVINTSDFSVNLVSNTYDSTRRFCILKFDGPLTRIGDLAFYDKPQLKTMRLPNSVTVIGGMSFYHSGLIEIQMDGVTSIGSEAFGQCFALLSPVNIPDGCSSLSSYAYSYCTAAHTINVPSSINYIGEGCFLNSANVSIINMYPSVPPVLEYNTGTESYDQFEGLAQNVGIKVPADSYAVYLSASGWSDYASIITSMS